MIVDQTTFRSSLLDPALPRPIGLSDGEGRAAGRRFDVYRNNVAVSLTEALETAFPVIRKLVGEDNFKILAGGFLRKHPPTSPLMMFYGSEMPGFLEQFEPTRGIGYLPDIAHLELAIRESYHAEDSHPADASKLQSLSPEALMETRLGLAPSVRVIRSDWPIHAIWRFNQEADAPKPAMVAEDVVVLRSDYDPVPYLLPPGGGAFLGALMKGASLGDALDETGTTDDFDLTAVLSLLLGTGAITRIGD